MTADDRWELINLLVIMTGKGEGYYKGMNEEQLYAEYDRLMVLEPSDK